MQFLCGIALAELLMTDYRLREMSRAVLRARSAGIL